MEYKKKNFREKMISDYCRKIIEKRTEVKLLEADIAGLFSKLPSALRPILRRLSVRTQLRKRKRN